GCRLFSAGGKGSFRAATESTKCFAFQRFASILAPGECNLPRAMPMTHPNHFSRCGLFLLLTVLSMVPHNVSAESERPASVEKPGLEPILGYIAKTWDTLTRSMEDCTTVVDPKLAENSVLYLPAGMPIPTQVAELEHRCHIQVKALPHKISGPGQVDTSQLPPGLLYLEHRYVVPGGRFNEMYGWDSYFIVRGLVQDGRVDLAKGMIE